MMRGVTPDPSYEEKICRGLIQPTFEYMTDSEAEATVNGRYRGDGRRMDQFVHDDPMMIDVPRMAEILGVDSGRNRG